MVGDVGICGFGARSSRLFGTQSGWTASVGAQARGVALTGLVDDKIVLVTGAASGIGRATAKLFASEGAAAVLVCDVDTAGVEQTAADIVAQGGDAIALTVDITDESQVEAMVATAVERWGRLDAAFNNAGISDQSVSFTDLDKASWDKMIAVNLTGPFLCMKHELRQMQAQGHGSIVNTSSGAGVIAAPNLHHYTAAKHGVIGLTKGAAAEFNNQQIRVNAVLPGMVDTAMVADWMGASPEMANAVKRMLPGKRLGEPEEVAGTVVFLCSDLASWVSGVSMIVDGGGINR